MGRQDWPESMFDSHLKKNHLWMHCHGHAGVKGNDRADRLAGKKATIANGLRLGRSDMLRSLRHYLRDTASDIAYRSPGGERRGKRKRSPIFPERTRESHRQSDEHWNRCKGNVRETSETLGGAHMSFSESKNIILN